MALNLLNVVRCLRAIDTTKPFDEFGLMSLETAICYLETHPCMHRLTGALRERMSRLFIRDYVAFEPSDELLIGLAADAIEAICCFNGEYPTISFGFNL